MIRFSRRHALYAAAILGANGCAQSRPPPPDAANDHPLAGLTDFKGGEVALPALVGHVTVVDFWASWCGPCRQAFRYLDQLHQGNSRHAVHIIGVSIDDNPDDADAFRAYLRPRFANYWDAGGYVRDRFNVVSLPTTVLLDEKLQVVYRQTGFSPENHRILEDHVRRLRRDG